MTRLTAYSIDHLDRRQNTRDDLLTLLIIDVRSGEKDKQLAEVNVPLASYDGRRYWANAQDIASCLLDYRFLY
jgi:hypothetical protein